MINVSQEKDANILFVYITYVVPFCNNFISKVCNYGDWILVTICVILFLFGKPTVNNPILKIKRYKTYSIDTEQGVKMILFSKKDIRNNQSVNRVIRLFEGYVMEV